VPTTARSTATVLTAAVAALAICLAVLVPGAGGEGPRGDLVSAVPHDGPLTSYRLDETLVGAHPVTPLTRSLRVRTAADGAGARSRGLDVDLADTAVPARVLAAYRAAAGQLARTDPGCRLDWPLLAGIGKVESGHAYGGAVDHRGDTLTPILGPVLDGSPGIMAIADTDDGRWDTDETWDRAVGPMQFIPTSWVVHGADGNGDGSRNPSNISDAALAAAGYLCTGSRDLRDTGDRRAAVFSYNHSQEYVDLVLAWAAAYADGVAVLTGSLRAFAVDGKDGAAAFGTGDRDGDQTGEGIGDGEDGREATPGQPPVVVALPEPERDPAAGEGATTAGTATDESGGPGSPAAGTDGTTSDGAGSDGADAGAASSTTAPEPATSSDPAPEQSAEPDPTPSADADPSPTCAEPSSSPTTSSDPAPETTGSEPTPDPAGSQPAPEPTAILGPTPTPDPTESGEPSPTPTTGC
jgi:hypothetical protein